MEESNSLILTERRLKNVWTETDMFGIFSKDNFGKWAKGHV